jgi:hypothetical protein
MGGATINLFAIAVANADTLAQSLQDLLTSVPADEAVRLSEFSERIQHDGRISINMRQSVLISFLTFSEHQNVYEWADERSRVGGVPREQILREKLGRYYPRRTAFDSSFEDGERFRYGALNIGGAGAPKYGEFCAVLHHRVSAERSEVAYLRSDSLKTYMKRGPVLDEEALRGDAAPHSHRHCLATMKHAGELGGHPEDRWPSMVCSATDFIETVFMGPLAASDVEVIRMPQRDHDFRFHNAFEAFRGRLGKAEKILCADFVIARRLIRQHGISLEVVPDVSVAGLGA